MVIMGHEVPEAWIGVLQRIRSGLHPDAILAGGALRDLVWGYEPKDLDIFVPWRPGALTRVLLDYRWRVAGVLDFDTYAGGTAMRGEVKALQSIAIPGLPEVQIIHLELPRWSMSHVISRMDFGACQIATDGEGWTVSEAAEIDLACHCFTLVNCEDATQFARSQRRADRWAKRFPAHSFDMSIGRHVMQPIPSFEELTA
jgi:hypothetical protein